MSCHESHKETGKNQSHSLMKHMLHMVLCCGIPIVILLILPFIAKYNTGAAVFLSTVTPFICPVLMGGMMIIMFRENKKIVAVKQEEDRIEENN